MRKTETAVKYRDDYLRLVHQFPLRKIRTEAGHVDALKISGRLIGMKRKLTHGESQYVDVLVLLIQEFERSHEAAKLPRVTGVAMLKHLMSERGMAQKELAHLLRIGEAAASMILNGSRELTKSHVQALSRHFGVGVQAFFG
jgi:antitoxin component HigA of HigAB toxin-antitoxin module